MIPFLKNIKIEIPPGKEGKYPFNIPAIKGGLELKLSSFITFVAGENGSGKSTLLEALADKIGFNPEGGSRNSNYAYQYTETELAWAMKLGWMPKVTTGFFMRAESFFNYASYLDELAKDDGRTFNTYGGKSLHEQSHGESFLSLFTNHFEKGIFILDEPEAALSPQRLLVFMGILHRMAKSGDAQFIIATHSPILLTLPGAVIYQLDENGISQVNYDETSHFRLTKAFLNDPDHYLRLLLEEK